MIYNEEMKINCNVKIDVWDIEVNKIIETIDKHNLIVTNGKNLIRDMLGLVAGVTGLNYFAIGTDNTTVQVTDTTLGTEVFRDTFTKTNLSSAKINIQYYLGSGSANGNTLTEAGLFGDDATGTPDSGTLFARVTHTSIVKTSSIAVTYSWDVNIG